MILINMLLLVAQQSIGQSKVFGVMGGMTLSGQTQSNYTDNVLVTGHIAGYLESLSESNTSAVFGRLGFYNRGSAAYIPPYIINGERISGRDDKFRYGNLSLQLGVKKKFQSSTSDLNKLYVAVGTRFEYNLKNHFPPNHTNYEDITQKFVFGMSVYGGYELMWSRLVGMFFELSVHPDVTEQVIVPAQPAISNPNIVWPERHIRNYTVEFTMGFRFVREVIYVD